jgi:hypothetical protein
MDGYISNKKHIFCGWSRKNLQAKVTCNTRPKSEGRRASESPRETPPPRSRRDQTSSPVILGRSFLKIVRAIDIGKGEIKFDIDGVRSAFKSTTIQGMYHDEC